MSNTEKKNLVLFVFEMKNKIQLNAIKYLFGFPNVCLKIRKLIKVNNNHSKPFWVLDGFFIEKYSFSRNVFLPGESCCSCFYWELRAWDSFRKFRRFRLRSEEPLQSRTAQFRRPDGKPWSFRNRWSRPPLCPLLLFCCCCWCCCCRCCRCCYCCCCCSLFRLL